MERWEGKVAIVTGASAGIGAAIVKTLAENGLKVIGLARRVTQIEELAVSLTDVPGEIFAYECDVTKEDNILEAFAWTTENVGPVAVMINNAGLTQPTNLTDGDTDQWRVIFDVNVMALCICTREAVKIMKENDISGHIIQMNAIAGHHVPQLPIPDFNVYPASKFAVTALTESLRQELRYLKIPIKVTSLSPGIVRSEFQSRFPDSGIKEMITQMPALQPEDIAEAVKYVLATPPHVQINELTVVPLGS